ncbi:hypothetical protein TEA_018796 [Camellia sinensis var. sinensis]|uniref:DNA topoisomerase n=1 Tax=Camellia sinensis var. sinensis TaxID=542762 RepID=A0A4S4DAG9_CAMSN|nr:hypothetical protein TEA_018796 [Camellia sinensis var. sinensis]
MDCYLEIMSIYVEYNGRLNLDLLKARWLLLLNVEKLIIKIGPKSRPEGLQGRAQARKLQGEDPRSHSPAFDSTEEAKYTRIGASISGEAMSGVGGGGGGGGGGRTIRVLNVAEKPSVAKAVAGILSKSSQCGMRVRDGRSRFNRIFEFAYTIHGQQCHMLFTSVTGHLMELDFEDRYRKWHSCDPLLLYQAPVRKFDKLDIKRTLEEEARKCQWLVLWLDCDREGENIAFEVVEVCTEANRHLNVWRARFSALIERDIRESVQALVRPNQLFADAVDVRQEIDLRIGASFTRFQTMLLRDAFNLDFAADDRNVTKVRQQEKLKYPPHPLNTIELEKRASRYFRMSSEQTMKVAEDLYQTGFISYPRTETDSFSERTDLRGAILHNVLLKDPCIVWLDSNYSTNGGFLIKVISHANLVKFRFHGLWNSHLMHEMLGLSSKEADFSDFENTLQLCKNRGGILYGVHMLNAYWTLEKDFGGTLVMDDDKAHPPIHPTKFSGGQSGWSQDHHRLYELFVRHFLACVSKPAVGAETTVEIDIAGEMFSASGKVILESRLRRATSAKRLAWDQFRRTGCASMRIAPRRAFNNTGWVTVMVDPDVLAFIDFVEELIS